MHGERFCALKWVEHAGSDRPCSASGRKWLRPGPTDEDLDDECNSHAGGVEFEASADRRRFHGAPVPGTAVYAGQSFGLGGPAVLDTQSGRSRG